MSVSRKKKSTVKRRPLILIAPSGERKGVEFGDASISLADTYQQAVMDAGALPLILPGVGDGEMAREFVQRADGVLLTGGDDINPKLYADKIPRELAKTVSPPVADRDLRELLLIAEIFRQRKPVLGIC